MNKIFHNCRQFIAIIFRKAIFGRDILARNVTGFLQTLAERGREVRRVGKRRTPEKSDHRHRRLLRARREWPCGRSAGEKRNELAPSHSITSSARAMTDAGISRPIAFAVFRLIANSNVTGCAMGRSPGLVPRKILSV